MTPKIDSGMALQRVNLRECLVNTETASAFIANLARFSGTDAAQAAELEATSRSQLELAYGYGSEESDSERKPFVFKDGIAVIPIHGTLLNRFNSSWGFVTGYNYVRRMLNAACDDDDVDLIVFDVDSPGGEAAGCFELAQEIMDAREIKPSLAMVDSLSASGGYALACAATRMYAIPSARIGSIGVYRMHIDLSEMMKRDGVKVTFATAGDHKVDGNPYEPISADVLKEWEESAGKTWDDFIAIVAEARDIPDSAVRDTQARVYRAEEALDLGLIDAVRTTTEAVAAFVAELADDNPSTEDEDENMENKGAKPEVTSGVTMDQVTAAVAAGIAADRQRSAAIRGCDEAKGKQNLANELASTDVTLEQAKVLLNAAATETPPAPAKKAPKAKVGDPEDESEDEAEEDAEDEAEEDAEEDAEEAARVRRKKEKVGGGDGDNHFDKAMNKSKHPNAGVGRENEERGDGDLTDAQQADAIIRDFAGVTGFKAPKAA